MNNADSDPILIGAVQPMKIFFVNTNKKWGGGEKWHLETACAMRERGHEVAILTLAGKDLQLKANQAGIRTLTIYITNLSALNPFRIILLTRLLSKEKPDTLILNFSADVKAVGIAAKLAGIKEIIYRRGSAIPIKNSFLNRFLFSRIITRIIANSEETKRTILQNNSTLFPEEKIKVIYNGINIKQFDLLPGSSLYTRKGREVLIGSAGRLSQEKGHKFLIEMAVMLQKKHLDFTLLIAGEGPMLAALKNEARTAGVENRIVFMGFVNPIKAFMETIDIFVLPSLWEGFGYVSIEAMACKKPVVAFHLGSNPEIIVNQKTGLLIDPFNVTALSAGIEALMTDSVMREKFGYAGRKRVEALFDVSLSEMHTEAFLINV